ncbi:hypothetical protein SDC9_87349 [bioreactor metagenome]|uniref:Uncharacterized protein n=1 Tax=bioreactor metagenome TaxID=1076179 RepID=A0A644ZLF1_9ZZZZ
MQFKAAFFLTTVEGENTVRWQLFHRFGIFFVHQEILPHCLIDTEFGDELSILPDGLTYQFTNVSTFGNRFCYDIRSTGPDITKVRKSLLFIQVGACQLFQSFCRLFLRHD